MCMYDHVIARVPFNAPMIITSACLFISLINSNFRDLQTNRVNRLRLALLILNAVILVALFQTVTRKRFGALYTFAFVIILCTYFALKGLSWLWAKLKVYISFRIRLLVFILLLIYLRSVFNEKVMMSCQNWNQGLS